MRDSPLHGDFMAAYDQYSDAIFRFCYLRTGDRERGRDLMQEVFMKTWEYLVKGNVIDDMKAFLYRSATNAIVDQARRTAKRQEDSLENLQEAGFDIASDEDTTARASHAFTEEQVTWLLQKIEEPYRTVLILRYIDQMKPAEIAAALGVTTNVVSVRLNRGMKQLRSHMQLDG